jgi:raffinose/stachyose/melibiose transport system permease protein
MALQEDPRTAAPGVTSALLDGGGLAVPARPTRRRGMFRRRRGRDADGVFRYTPRTVVREGLLLLVAVAFSLPLFLVATLSLKSQSEIALSPNTVLPKHVHFGNYSLAWTGQSGGGAIGSSLVTSAVITACSILVLIALGSLGGYTLARRHSRLSSGLYFLFLLGLMLPFQLTIVPIYAAMRPLHLTGDILGMVIFYSGLLMPLSVFLYAGFTRSLPRDYEEAAYVDGATRWRTFRRVVFPQLRPITGTVAILAGFVIWNDFFSQLVFLSGSSKQTLPTAIYSFVGQYSAQWNLIFAAVVISLAPVLLFFLVAQRQMIRGFAGGIRG